MVEQSCSRIKRRGHSCIKKRHYYREHSFLHPSYLLCFRQTQLITSCDSTNVAPPVMICYENNDSNLMAVSRLLVREKVNFINWDPKVFGLVVKRGNYF